MSVEKEYAVLKPTVEDITGRILTAPLSEAERGRLAVCVAAHMLGLAAGLLRRGVPEFAELPLSQITREAFEGIIPMIDPAFEKLKN